MVQTAKQAVNAIVDIHKALACPTGVVFDEACMTLPPSDGRFWSAENGSSGDLLI
jgi:hypothetical protein